MARVQVVFGPTRVTVDADGSSIADLVRQIGEEMGIGAARPYRNGLPATLDQPIEDGDEVAFVRPTGEKGA
jgi:molybdopterin converting factor small subunit